MMNFKQAFFQGPGLTGIFLFTVVFAFQNCSKVNFASKPVSSSSQQAADIDVDTDSGKDPDIVLTPITNPKVVINNGDLYTNLQNVSVQASADNATEVYLTEAFTCDQEGEWYPLNRMGIQRALANLNTNSIIYARFRNDEGAVSDCVSDSIIHDNIPPAVAIKGENVNVNQITSQSDFDFSFEISDDGSGVGLINCLLSSQTLPCLSLNGLNVKGLNPGQKNLVVEVTDMAGNKGRANLPWEVVAGLGNASITINDGALYTANNLVGLKLAAENATTMRIHSDPECKTGDTEKFQATREYVLPLSNATNTVYAQFYNEANDKSACLSASILHDNLPPTLTLQNAPAMGEKIHGNFAFTATAADTGSGLKFLKCYLNGAAMGCDNGAPQNVTLGDEGIYTLKVVAKDNVDNQKTETVSFEYLKSIGDISLLINNGARYTNDPAGAVRLQLAAVNAKEMYITNQAGCGAGGAWESLAAEKDWTLGQLNSGSTSVYVKYRNTAARVSPCISASIIHDSIPYGLAFVDPPVMVDPAVETTLLYNVLENGLAIQAGDVAELKGCTIKKGDADQAPLACPEVGKVPLTGLEEGSYTVEVTVADAAKNETKGSHSFTVKSEVPMCDDPALADYHFLGQCLALQDSFERSSVTGGDQFNWTSIIDDQARTDNQNVQANIFSTGQYGFGEASDKDKAVYVTGRLGGSNHDIYLISVPLDLSKFDKLKVDFSYLPIHLEHWFENWRDPSNSRQAMENIRIEVCSSSLSNCGIAGSISSTGLKSSYWKSVFTQNGYVDGWVTADQQMTDTERGLSNTGRNHTKSSWLEGSATIDLNTSQIQDKSKVVFRITMKLDEGFKKKLSNGNPDFTSDLEDGFGLDNVRATAIQNQPEGNPVASN